MRTVLALVAACLLGGCTLIDQTVIAKWTGTTPPPPPPAVIPPSQQPLVTIPVGSREPDVVTALHQAVTEAVARKADVEFDVVSVVPATGTPTEQVAAADGIIGDARTVARAINADGVDDDRIHLQARALQGVANRQIQVFVH